MRAESFSGLFENVTKNVSIVGAINGVSHTVPERCQSCLSAANENRDDLKLDEKQTPNTHSTYLRDKEPSRLLGHSQAHGQADDQIQDQQQQIGQPSKRQENEASA